MDRRLDAFIGLFIVLTEALIEGLRAAARGLRALQADDDLNQGISSASLEEGTLVEETIRRAAPEGHNCFACNHTALHRCCYALVQREEDLLALEQRQGQLLLRPHCGHHQNSLCALFCGWMRGTQVSLEHRSIPWRATQDPSYSANLARRRG